VIQIGQGIRTEFDDMVINGDLNSRYAYGGAFLAELIPLGKLGKLGKVGKLTGKGPSELRHKLDLQMFAEGTGNRVPTKLGAGSDPNNFVNEHAKKHLYDPTKPSTPNRSQYGKDVDVFQLRRDTMNNPDKAYSNWPNPNNPNTQRITKYYKEYDGNISTPDTPTGSHRVFENIGNPKSSSHFPYVPRK
ncbi:hypothetical protein, partial [Paenibacillus popilliae]